MAWLSVTPLNLLNINLLFACLLEGEIVLLPEGIKSVHEGNENTHTLMMFEVIVTGVVVYYKELVLYSSYFLN